MEEITTDPKLFRRLDSFNKRWNIQNKENKDRLKTRCLTSIIQVFDSYSNILKKSYWNTSTYYNKISRNISLILGIQHIDNSYSSFENKSIFKYINKLNFNNNEDYTTFILFIESLLNSNLEAIPNQEMAKSIANAFQLSNERLKIIKENDEYIIIPQNVEVLDTPLVIDNLHWLNNFNNSKTHFAKAIKLERNPSLFRNIIDELRLSLELLLKELFNNNKSLENQKSEIGNYLKGNNISTTISNMFIKLLELYANYNNENAKHGDSINENEIDYMIYLTGTFIRLITQVEENKKSINN